MAMTTQTDPHRGSQTPPRAQTLEELSRFRAAMDISGDAIYLVDRATMRFVDVNRPPARAWATAAKSC